MKKVYFLENLCCAHCASKIERAISKLDCVLDCSLNFMLQKLTVTFADEERFDEIKKIISKIEPDCEIKYEYAFEI